MKRSLYLLCLYLLLPIALLLFGLYLTISYNQKYAFTVLNYPFGDELFDLRKEGEFLAGDRAVAHFTAPDEHLGTISVRFHTYNRDNDDYIVFKLREKGKQDWYYLAEYKVDQFQPDELFTFGFPEIVDSKGKEYEFELESKAGISGNAVSIQNKIFPVFESIHQYPKQALMADKNLLLWFGLQKLKIYLTDPIFVITALTYFAPFVFYLAWIIFLRKYIRNTKIEKESQKLKKILRGYPLSALVIGFIFVSLLLPNRSLDLPQLILIVLYLVSLRIYRLNYQLSFKIALVFIFLCPLLLIFGFDGVARQSATWAFVFLVIGTVNGIVLVRGERK